MLLGFVEFESDSVSMFLVSALCSVVQTSIVQLTPFFSLLLWCHDTAPTPSRCVSVVVATDTGGWGRGQVRGLVATRLFQPLWTRLTKVLTHLKQVQGLKLEK